VVGLALIALTALIFGLDWVSSQVVLKLFNVQ
jgi:hypothetical protein